MTETLTKIVVDCSTGEQTIVPLTAEEIAQREADAAAFAEQQASAEAEAAQVAEDKAAAIAALVALGLTEAQIAALSK
jgi:Holliday junction resolvasome RuvABC DNA-binding subunit